MAVELINFDAEEYPWSQNEVLWSGAPLTDKLRGISIKIESDDEELFCGGDEAVSIQSGNIKKSGSVTVTAAALDAMHNAVVAAGGRFITDVKWDLVNTVLPAPGRPLVVRSVIGAKFNSMAYTLKQGDKFIDCELPFKFLRYLQA